MYYGIAQYKDEYGQPYESSVRKGGFKSLQTALKRIISAGTGYVVDDQRVTVAVVKDGVDLLSRASQSFPNPSIPHGAPPA